MFETADVGVFLGLDVGKSAHHGHGLTPAGKKVFDKQLPNSEPKLQAVFHKLAAKVVGRPSPSAASSAASIQPCTDASARLIQHPRAP